MRISSNRSEEFSEMLAQIAKQVRGIPYEASSITIFAELDKSDKIECYIAGCLIGMMVALREQVRTEESMELFQQYVTACIPSARKIADEWIKDGPGQHRVDMPPRT